MATTADDLFSYTLQVTDKGATSMKMYLTDQPIAGHNVELVLAKMEAAVKEYKALKKFRSTQEAKEG